MLIILFLFALFRTLQGVPLSSPGNVLHEYSTIDPRDMQSHLGQRSVNDIVVSCFATIIACTWKAVHPNIPAPTDCWWTKFKRQMTTMVYALLAPELITVWALRQRMGANAIMDEYNTKVLKMQEHNDDDQNRKGIITTIKRLFHGIFCDAPVPESSAQAPQWTLAHGFFLQMGGFMLSEGGKPVQTMFDGNWEQTAKDKQFILNIQKGVIDPPRITEEDIQDRSKGDAISKVYIILQTTWFIVQCIARWSAHLSLTELEVVTLGFAVLNGITYALWWHKPQNVGRPVFLERKNTQYDICTHKVPVGLETSNDGHKHTRIKVSGRFPDVPQKRTEEIPDSDLGTVSYLRRKLRKAMRTMWALPFTTPWYLLMSTIRPLYKLSGAYSEVPSVMATYRVPMFYNAASVEDDMEMIALIPFVFIGTLFGAVHLIPSWFLEFSSPRQMWIWRASTIVITAEPALIGFMIYGIEVIGDEGAFFGIVFIFLSAIGLPLYPIARLILLLFSLTSLESLTASALQTIEWTTFIPHL